MTSLASFRYADEIKGFLAWWRDELAACVPERVKALSARPGRTDIRLGRDRVEIDRIEGEAGRTFADGRPLEALDSEGWGELGALLLGTRARLFLEPHDVWCTRLTLPAGAKTGLRRAIALQLHLVAPLHPDLLEWNWCVERREKGRIHILVAMARRERIDRIIELFEGQDLAPPPLFCMTELGPLQLRKGIPIRRSPASRQERQMFALVALLLATVPLTTLFGTQLLKFTNEAKLTQLRTQIGPKLAAEQHARKAASLRRALTPMGQGVPVSTALVELSGIIPEKTYVQQFSWDMSNGIDFTLAGELDTAAQAAIGKGTKRFALSPTSAPAEGEAAVQASFRASLR